jgi:hypothetical protein
MEGLLIALVVGFVLAFLLGGPKTPRVASPPAQQPPPGGSTAPTEPGPAAVAAPPPDAPRKATQTARKFK